MQLLLCAGPRGVEDVMQALLRPSDESVSKRLSCPTAPPEGASQTPSKRGSQSLSQIAVIRILMSGRF